MKLHYKEAGEGAPFIFLHGLFGSSVNWNSISKNFIANHKVYLIDQRNHGRSPHDDAFDYGVMSEDLLEFFDDLKIDKAILLGHSMGGKVALTFAAKYPERLSNLVVVDISHKAYSFRDEHVLKGMQQLAEHGVSSRSQAEAELGKYIPDFGVRQFILQNLYWDENKKLTWRLNLEAISVHVMNIGNAIEQLEPYTGSCLFVKGQNSDYIELSDYEEIMEKYPNAVIEEIKGAGHWIHADNPADFVVVLQNFLKDE